MTWIKLDDNAVDHPKVESLSDRAFRWWVKGLSYASRFLTDGLLPPVFWKKVPTNDRKELTTNKLWDWIDPDFMIHDYQHYQSRKEDVEADKERNREKSKAYRERRKAGRRSGDASPVVTGDVTGDALPDRHHPVTDPENREHIQRTENREQTTATPLPPRPLVSGEANPRTWGKIHGEHVSGFCDWVCLPEFIFAEFCRKSGQSDKPDGGAAYVRGWAKLTRAHHEGTPVGDNLKFWRDHWAASHPTKKPTEKPFSVADALAREAERKAGAR